MVSFNQRLSLDKPENPPTLPENTFQHNYQLSMSFLSRETHCPQDCEHVFHLNFDTIRIISLAVSSATT